MGPTHPAGQSPQRDRLAGGGQARLECAADRADRKQMADVRGKVGERAVEPADRERRARDGRTRIGDRIAVAIEQRRCLDHDWRYSKALIAIPSLEYSQFEHVIIAVIT